VRERQSGRGEETPTAEFSSEVGCTVFVYASLQQTTMSVAAAAASQPPTLHLPALTASGR